jgi:hypothetical protein
MLGGELVSLVDSIDVTLWVSENGEVIFDGELMVAIEDGQRDAGVV